MAPTDVRPPADERARAALEALRAGAPGGTGGEPVVVRGLLDRALDRWPALVGTVDRLARPGVAVVVVVAALVVVAVLGVGWMAVRAGGAASDGPVAPLPFTTTTTPGAAGPGGTSSAGATPATTARALVVHAAGAVAEPGVHRVPAGARVADVLAAAGGPAPDADLDRVNLAAPVADGQRLYVPRLGEPVPPAVVGPSGGDAGGGGAGGAGGTAAPAGPLDLNQATEQQLDELPGIGPATASAIVEHRTRNGPFRSVDGLLEVRGIGPAKLEALRDLVTVG